MWRKQSEAFHIEQSEYIGINGVFDLLHLQRDGGVALRVNILVHVKYLKNYLIECSKSCTYIHFPQSSYIQSHMNNNI